MNGNPSEKEITYVREALAQFNAARVGKHIFTHLEWHMVGYEVDLDEKSAETVRENADLGLFFVPSYEIDTAYAVPSAYSAYRAFM